MLYLCEKNNIMGKGDRKTRKGKRFVGSSRKRTKLNCYGINKKEQKKIIDYQQEAAYAIKHNIVPFIIDETHKFYYYRGLREFENEPGYLTDTCLSAQDNYKALLKYFGYEYN